MTTTTQSQSQILNAVARMQLADEGLAAVKKAITDILAQLIDSRGGSEWDGYAQSDPLYFTNLEIVAEWLDDENSAVAAWRQERLEKYGN